jgi:hypothetical protein
MEKGIGEEAVGGGIINEACYEILFKPEKLNMRETI